MNKYLSRAFLSFTLCITGCSSGSSSEDENQVSIDGLWQNDSIVIAGQLAEVSWTFDSGDIVKTLSFNNNPEPIIKRGNYTMGSLIVMSSGISAYQIDITYYDPDSAEPAVTEHDVIYVDAKDLYFGNLKINELCEGEFYNRKKVRIDVVNGVAYEIELDETACFSRPDSLNFNQPYQLSEI